MTTTTHVHLKKHFFLGGISFFNLFLANHLEMIGILLFCQLFCNGLLMYSTYEPRSAPLVIRTHVFGITQFFNLTHKRSDTQLFSISLFQLPDACITSYITSNIFYIYTHITFESCFSIAFGEHICTLLYITTYISSPRITICR